MSLRERGHGPWRWDSWGTDLGCSAPEVSFPARFGVGPFAVGPPGNHRKLGRPSGWPPLARFRRGYAIISLLARCGLRTAECVTAQVQDIRRLGDETVLYVQSKGTDDKTDFVVLVQNTLGPIMEYLISRGPTKPSDPLFAPIRANKPISTRTIRHLTKRRARNAKIDSPYLSAHSYRHFFCTTGVNSAVPLDEVREGARHASLASTQIYIHRANRAKGITEKKVDEALSGESASSDD